MAWPEDALSADEQVVTEFRPHWKLLFVPIVWGVVLFLVFLAVMIWTDAAFVGWLTTVVVLGLLAYFVVRPLVAWWTTLYVLTSERLITRMGLIAKSGIEIPLENITNVNFNQTVIERMLGAGDLLIESAGSTGQSKFRDIPHPDEFQATLYKIREQRTIALSGSTTVTHAAPPPPASDSADAIRELAKLRDEGLISPEEYDAKRRELLEGL